MWLIGRREWNPSNELRKVISTHIMKILKDEHMTINFESSSWFHEEMIIFLNKDISGSNSPLERFYRKTYTRNFNQPDISKNCLAITPDNFRGFQNLFQLEKTLI